MNIGSVSLAFAVSLMLSLASAVAVASDGPAMEAGLAGHWLSVNANSGSGRDLQIGTDSISLAIQPDGNLDMTSKTKSGGQQQFDTTHGRIDGDRLLFDNGRRATISQHGGTLELIDAGTPGRTVRFRRR